MPLGKTGLTRTTGSCSANQLRADTNPAHILRRQTPSPPTNDSPRLVEGPPRKASAESVLLCGRKPDVTPLLAPPSGTSLESQSQSQQLPGENSRIYPHPHAISMWNRVTPHSELSVSSGFDQVTLNSVPDAPDFAPRQQPQAQPQASDAESYNSFSESESESEDCCGAPRASSRRESQDLLDPAPGLSSPLGDEPPSPTRPLATATVNHAASALPCSRAANGSSQHLMRLDSDAHQLSGQLSVTRL